MSLPSLSLKVATRPQSCSEIPAGKSTPRSLRPLTVSPRPPPGREVATGAAPAVLGDPGGDLHAPLLEAAHRLVEAALGLEGDDRAALRPRAAGLAPVQAEGQAVGVPLGPRALQS